MPATAVITNLSQYIGEDKVIRDTIYQSDGTTKQNMTGWAVTFTIHKYGDPSVVYVTKTVGSGITILDQTVPGTVGDMDIAVAHADTVAMFPDQYEWRAVRDDTQNNVVLSTGLYTMLR